MSFDVRFCPSGRGKARCPPDPDFPDGKKIDLGILPNCEARLPYPAPECGHFLVTCKSCGASVAVTAAGRLDDPVSVTVPCKTSTLN